MNTYSPQSLLLTATQKGILAVLHNSPTPEVAYANTNGDTALITARNILERVGLVRVAGITAELTQAGKDAALANNIIGDDGSLTEEGAALVDSITAHKTAKVAEGFAFLRTLVI